MFFVILYIYMCFLKRNSSFYKKKYDFFCLKEIKIDERLKAYLFIVFEICFLFLKIRRTRKKICLFFF